LLVAFALVFGFVRPFVMEATCKSESMLPTLKVKVFVNKFVYRFRVGRGDVIVFESVEGENEDLIKRVVALPEDEVTFSRACWISGPRGTLNQREATGQKTYGPTIVPEGHVFAMGITGRSRVARCFRRWRTKKEHIEGEAFASFWPPSHRAVWR